VTRAGTDEALRRFADAYGQAAYRACVKAGDEEAAGRIAREMRALGFDPPAVGRHEPGKLLTGEGVAG